MTLISRMEEYEKNIVLLHYIKYTEQYSNVATFNDNNI